jgi:hypothetical protein
VVHQSAKAAQLGDRPLVVGVDAAAALPVVQVGLQKVGELGEKASALGGQDHLSGAVAVQRAMPSTFMATTSYAAQDSQRCISPGG